MTSPVTRAGALAAIGTLTVLAPLWGQGIVLLFGGIAVLALVVPREQALFEFLAGPGDVESGRLHRLAGFALAVTALAILATVDSFELPIVVFPMTVLILVGGNLAEAIVRARGSGELAGVTAFSLVGAATGFAGYATVDRAYAATTELSIEVAAFLAVSGAILAALCRTDLYRRDDPVVLLTVGILLWLFSLLPVSPDATTVGVGILVTVALGALAYTTGTASIAGMLTGVLLGFTTITLAGFHWFVALFAFFAIGGMATKYRYREKENRGVAEEDWGARGTGNVLGNSLVALVAVVGYAAAPDLPELRAGLLAVAFGGAVATALADTLSSEIGTLYDGTRLITTFERVEPGTNGGVTLHGGIAGSAGALIIGAIGIGLIPEIGPMEAIVVVIGGIIGMTADSLIGATIEDHYIGNQSVNLLATAVGGSAAALGAFVLSHV